MKVKEMIEILQKARPDAEVTATVNLSENAADNEQADKSINRIKLKRK